MSHYLSLGISQLRWISLLWYMACKAAVSADDVGVQQFELRLTTPSIYDDAIEVVGAHISAESINCGVNRPPLLDYRTSLSKRSCSSERSLLPPSGVVGDHPYGVPPQLGRRRAV